jgi:hypothetical protein
MQIVPRPSRRRRADEGRIPALPGRTSRSRNALPRDSLSCWRLHRWITSLATRASTSPTMHGIARYRQSQVMHIARRVSLQGCRGSRLRRFGRRPGAIGVIPMLPGRAPRQPGKHRGAPLARHDKKMRERAPARFLTVRLSSRQGLWPSLSSGSHRRHRR